MQAPTVPRPKFIASLTFRGFEISPQAVEALVGRPASSLVARGQSRKPGTTPFLRSAAAWKLAFPDSALLRDMIPALIDKLGGVENLLAAKAAVSPEYFEFEITMWIMDSTEQEGGFIENSTIEMLSRLGATLSLGFYPRHEVK